MKANFIQFWCVESEFIVKNWFHNWTSDLGWIWHIFGKFGSFQAHQHLQQPAAANKLSLVDSGIDNYLNIRICQKELKFCLHCHLLYFSNSSIILSFGQCALPSLWGFPSMKDNERMAITKITAEIFFIVKQCILLTEVSQSIMKLIKIFFFKLDTYVLFVLLKHFTIIKWVWQAKYCKDLFTCILKFVRILCLPVFSFLNFSKFVSVSEWGSAGKQKCERKLAYLR